MIPDKLFDIVCKLYPNGPDDNAIWKKARGNLAELELKNKTGKTAWYLALEKLYNGGGGQYITIELLLEAMLNDYKSNETLKSLLALSPNIFNQEIVHAPHCLFKLNFKAQKKILEGLTKYSLTPVFIHGNGENIGQYWLIFYLTRYLLPNAHKIYCSLETYSIGSENNNEVEERAINIILNSLSKTIGLENCCNSKDIATTIYKRSRDTPQVIIFKNIYSKMGGNIEFFKKLFNQLLLPLYYQDSNNIFCIFSENANIYDSLKNELSNVDNDLFLLIEDLSRADYAKCVKGKNERKKLKIFILNQITNITNQDIEVWYEDAEDIADHIDNIETYKDSLPEEGVVPMNAIYKLAQITNTTHLLQNIGD